MATRIAAVLVIGFMAAGGAMAQSVPDQAATVKAGATPEIDTQATDETAQPDGAQRVVGQPIGGIVVKGGQNPTQGVQSVAGNPIGGLIVKEGKNRRPKKAK